MATMMDDSEDGIRLSVRCRGASGTVAELEVLDISAGGCMVAYKGWDAQPGERVMTAVRGLGVQPSQLVWVEDGLAGIAFEKPLHAAVYDFLRAQLDGQLEEQRRAEEQAEEEERRRQARLRKVL